MDHGALPRAAAVARHLQRVRRSPTSAGSLAYLEHTGLSLGPELANEQVGGESRQDGQRHQAAGESPARAAGPGC